MLGVEKEVEGVVVFEVEVVVVVEEAERPEEERDLMRGRMRGMGPVRRSGRLSGFVRREGVVVFFFFFLSGLGGCWLACDS